MNLPPWKWSRGNGSEVDEGSGRLEAIERDARRRAARVLRELEEETRREAEDRAREILAAATQRLAADHARRETSQRVLLPSDAMKGRVIGRDGRNVRALERLTGVDVIVEESPPAVRLSSFDGVRREVARLTVERLVGDGRIHPARCEEAYEESRLEVHGRIAAEARRVPLEARVEGLHPRLAMLLGRLRYRTSHGQQVLAHLVECSRLAAMIAAELGADAEVARRAALLHDVGKALSHEVEGSHALVGGQIAKRYGEPEAVVHAIAAHHGEVEPRTVEATIVQTADALSGARPGARGESRTYSVGRQRELERLAVRHPGVEKAHAMRAGRELRVMVDPGAVDDAGAALISHEIAAAVEAELVHPGRVKVIVIRESRATEYSGTGGEAGEGSAALSG